MSKKKFILNQGIIILILHWVLVIIANKHTRTQEVMYYQQIKNNNMQQKILHLILFFLTSTWSLNAQTDSVNMTNFNGVPTDVGIDLVWTTNGEHNVEHFILERSLDAINFEPIKTMKTLNTTGTKNYTYSDNNIFREQMYYRITTQLSTSQEVSSIIAVVRNDRLDLPNIMIYPTITSDVVNVVKNSSEDLSGAFIRVFDLSGNVLLNKAVGGDFLVETIDVSKYQAGVYVIELYKDKFAKQAKIIKQ